MKRRDSEVEFLESPVLGEMLTSNFPVISPAAMPVTTLETFPTITSGELSTILEETAARDAKRSGSTPPLEIVKPPTPKTEMPAPLQRPTPPPKEPFTAQPLPMSQNNSIQSIKSPTSSSSSLKVAGRRRPKRHVR
jgi:hypothetical protein